MNDEIDRTKELYQTDKDILIRLLEYVRYLYEEEKIRKNYLHDAVRIYIIVLTFIVGFGAFKLIPHDKIKFFSQIVNKQLMITGLILFSLSIISIFISFIFTILILKVWKFSRLSEPEVLSFKSMFMQNEVELLSAIISDYVIATNKFHEVNEKKAKLLSHALFYLLTGLVIFVISIFIISGEGISLKGD